MGDMREFIAYIGRWFRGGMKKEMSLMRVLVLVSIFLAGHILTTQAAPVVSSIGSIYVNNTEAISLRGNNFGEKSTAGPLVWDNFENGIDDAIVAGNSPTLENMDGDWVWRDSTTGIERVKYTSAYQKPNSIMSARSYYHGDNWQVALLLYYNLPNTGDDAYFTFYWKPVKEGDIYSRNRKPWRTLGSGINSYPKITLGFGDPSLEGDEYLRSSVVDTDNTCYPDSSIWSGPKITDIENEWVRFEVYLKQSSKSIKDGTMQVWTHRPFKTDPSVIKIGINDTSYGTRCSDDYWKSWRFNYFWETGGGTNGHAYLDDLYFDNTQARVEIGNNESFDKCTHREIQVPTSWSDDEIIINVNQGSFEDGETAYIFVVDGDGETNQEGYPIALSFQEEYHPSDTNLDKCIEMGELMAYISEWLNGEADITGLIQAIGLWKWGCPYVLG